MQLPTGLSLKEQMLFIRLLENRLQQLCDEGLGADFHFSKGQEAISVGVHAALRDTDYTVAHHRTIAHAVSKGVPLYPLVAELLGKADGINGGRAGEMHMSYPDKRFMFSFQLVGTCIPVAAGIAWAVKNVKKTDDVVVVFHGDASTANGQFHEGLNIAAVQKVPLLLICENNRLAGNVQPEHYQPVGTLRQRALAYGIGSDTVDGNNVEEVADQVAWILRRHMRDEGTPFMLVCDTARLGKHKQGMGDLRTKEHMAALALNDPLRDVPPNPDLAMIVDEVVESVLNSADPHTMLT